MKNQLSDRTPTKSARPFSYRPLKTLESRLNDVVAVSRRSKASVLDESLEVQLPVLEKRHARQLRALRQQRRNSFQRQEAKAV